MILFYTTEINNDHALLEEDEFVHCCKVLRHREGDIIHITDGKGQFAQARIIQVQKRSAQLEIVSLEQLQGSANSIELAIAPPKTRTRWEWLLEKTVEVGVDIISPINTFNIERKKINVDRNSKIIRTAALQSKRTVHPTLNEMSSLKKYLSKPEVASADKYVCHLSPDNTRLLDCKSSNRHLIVFIGPEGDFSDEELKLFEEHDCTTVNISENRLRTETAAIIAISHLTQLIS